MSTTMNTARNAKGDQQHHLMTPPPTEEKLPPSQKSSSNHSDQETKSTSATTAGGMMSPSYLESLKEERDQLTQYTDGLQHVFSLIDKEISRLSVSDASPPSSKQSMASPSIAGGHGPVLSEIIPVPVDLYPNYNFVGRILGPRGTTAKQLETTTGCKIVIHGRKKDSITTNTSSSPSPSVTTGGGSSTDGVTPSDQPSEPLTIEISYPANAPGAAQKLEMGVNVVKALLIPPADGQDELKRQQLMVLANMKGTYRPRTASNTHHSPSQTHQYGGGPCGDYTASPQGSNNQYQNLLPFGYHLPVIANCQHEMMLKSLLMMGLTTTAPSTIDQMMAAAATSSNDQMKTSQSQQQQQQQHAHCENAKCAILRSLIGNNVPLSNNFLANVGLPTHFSPPASTKMNEVVNVMKWYEMMNRFKLASLVQDSETSNAKEIGKQMCSSIGSYGVARTPKNGGSTSSKKMEK